MNTHLYEEIRSIEEIINENKTKSEGLYTEDDYTKLMKKEDKVLDLLDDMKKKKNEESASMAYFLSSPIHVIIFKTFRIIMKIITESCNKNDIFQVIDLILMRENVIYVGIALVIFAFLLMFITI